MGFGTLSGPRPRSTVSGVQVTIDVLKPGEETAPIRHNSTQVNFCIRGGGRTFVNDREIAFTQYDVWNHPAYAIYRHVNDTKDLQVRLTYSNAALLEMMRVHVVDEAPVVERSAEADDESRHDPRRRNPFGTFPIGGEKRLEFRLSAGNVLNHAVFNNPQGSITSGTFGQITGANNGNYPERTIVLGLRFQF